MNNKDKSEYTDSELIAACLEKKPQAQRKLYTQFSPQLYGVCLRYAANKNDAQDFLQEAFIRIFLKLHLFRFEAPLGAWLRKITVNVCLEQLRKQKTIEKIHQDLPLLEENNADDDTIFQKLATDELIDKIQQLPTGYRMVFNLFAIEGYSHMEISEKLNIEIGTSKSQYNRAKSRLKKQIDAERNNEQKRQEYEK